MIAGDLLTFSQIQLSRRDVQKSLDADQKQLDVLRVHTDVLEIASNLSYPLANHDLRDLKSNTEETMQALLVDIQQAKQALASSVPADAKLLAILQATENALPAEVGALERLAAAGDWDAAQLRFAKQVETVTALTSQAAKSVSDEVSRRRVLVVTELRNAQHRFLWILAITALISILVAAGLGASVTAGIIRPLGELKRVAQSLAAGDFRTRKRIVATDELATLWNAFHVASSELNQLYNALTSREARFRALIENSSDLVAVIDSEGIVRYSSPASSRVVGLTPEDLNGRNLLDLFDAGDVSRLKLLLFSLPPATAQPIAFQMSAETGASRILEGFATNLCSEPAVGGIVINVRDVSDKKQAESEIVSLSRRLIVAQEDERARIAAELHDDFGQRIAALAISLASLRREIPSEVPAVGRAERIQHDLIQIGDSIRRLSHALHPALLEHCGLPAALRSLSSEFSGLYVRFSCAGDDSLNRIPADAAVCLYRVAQEALRNVLKHSAVSEAELKLDLSADSVRLTIQDRGIGIKPLADQRFRGLGLASMRERVRQQHGVFCFENPSEGGTRVIAVIPRHRIIHE